MAEKKQPSTKPYDFWFHAFFVGFVACYFSGILYWFGALFLTGGTPEHAVMSIVIPVTVLIGAVAMVTLGGIALEGRRVAKATPKVEATPKSEPAKDS